jgi:mRNA-degrading endonuclease YafQ of YafQ-DinJ toxin-antitoxin module
MWEILEHRRVDRQLRKAPREVLVRYEKWKDVVGLSGLAGLRLIKGFHDESLSGEWSGYRSSRLGAQWRVIYRTRASVIEVHVASVTPHDYRRS